MDGNGLVRLARVAVLPGGTIDSSQSKLNHLRLSAQEKRWEGLKARPNSRSCGGPAAGPSSAGAVVCKWLSTREAQFCNTLDVLRSPAVASSARAASLSVAGMNQAV